MWALERRQNKASKSHLVLFRAATAVRAARRRHSRHVRQGQHRRKRKRLLLLERLCPSRNRRFKRGIGRKKSAPFLCVLCACIFSSKKRRQNTSPSEQNKPYYLHALLPNKARWCILHVSFENATTFTRQHPSIHPSDDDALLLLPDRNADHHRRCKTLERERERDNLLIVQRRRERKNFEGEKKKGEILSSAQLKCIRGIASSKPATTLITRRRRGSNRVSAVPPKRTRLRFGRSRSK